MSLSRGPSGTEAVKEWPRTDLHFKEATEEEGIRTSCCLVWIQNSQQITGSSPGLVGGSVGSLLKPLVLSLQRLMDKLRRRFPPSSTNGSFVPPLRHAQWSVAVEEGRGSKGSDVPGSRGVAS